MKQIITPVFQRGRNAEHFLFHHNVLAILTKEKAAELKIEAIQADYARLFEREDQAFKQNTAFEQTQDVAALDKTRDDLFLYVRNVVDANLTCPVADKKAAAEKLSFVIRPYRDANNKSYMENTTLVINMVTDLQQSANATHLAALGLTDAVAQLKTANEQFNEAFTQRSDVRVTRASNDKMVTIRPQVDAAYTTVATVINALYTVNQYVTHDEAQAKLLSQLIDAINGPVMELQQTLSRRGAGKTTDLPTDGDTSDPGTDTPDPGTGGTTPGTGGTDNPETPGTGGNTGGGTGDTGDDFV